jgi:L-ribulose-5-phosphate 4-epimerase
VTRNLSDEEIRGDYETNTGRVIVERFVSAGIDPVLMPACLDASHGPFVWGDSPEVALENAIALEHAAAIAIQTLTLAPETEPIGQALLDRHFFRKNGPAAYYGQPHRGMANLEGRVPTLGDGI